VTSHRTALREAVRTAITNDAYFEYFTFFQAWAQSRDTDALPAFGLAIRRESSGLVDYKSHQRVMELRVYVKRTGGDDIEDVLDADSAAIESVVLPLLRADHTYLHVEVSQTEIDINGNGESRVGMIEVMFNVMRHTDMPV
jgi:hypothetical protein